MKLSNAGDWIRDWRAYFAEFLGTFAFVFVSSSAVLVDNLYGDIGTVGVALTVGVSYAALVFVTVHLSGGYLNPAIAVALWLAGQLANVKAVFFILAQVLASFAAAFCLLLIFSEESKIFALGGPILGIDVSLSMAVVVEAVMSAILVFAVFGTMVDRGGPVSFGPLVLGFILLSATIIAFPVSGAAFNPARVLGPLIVSGSADNLMVWVIGPLTGSLFGIVYEYLFLRKGKRS